jgi:hypothetical protein
MGHSITWTGAQALRPRLLISSLLGLFAATSADAGQSPAYSLKSESSTGLQKICAYSGPQDHVALTADLWQLCPHIPTPAVSSTGVPRMSPEPQTGLSRHLPISGHVVPLVDPSEQLSQIRAQSEASHVRQQIALTAATINARGNDADELVGLLNFWGEDQARLTELFAVAQQQRVLLDAQADELLELQRQLADARFVTP